MRNPDRSDPAEYDPVLVPDREPGLDRGAGSVPEEQLELIL